MSDQHAVIDLIDAAIEGVSPADPEPRPGLAAALDIWASVYHGHDEDYDGTVACELGRQIGRRVAAKYAALGTTENRS